MNDRDALEMALSWIVHDIKERYEESQQEIKNDFNDGRIQGYWEVLDMI